jgi:hypothetical protein
VRSYGSILLSLALLVAFVQAPFLHTHQHESTQKHAGAFLHVHLGLATPHSKNPEIRDLDPDEDALYEGWFSAPPVAAGLIAPVLRTEPLVLPLPERSGWTLEVPLQVGHDPPLICPKSPRGPPA